MGETRVDLLHLLEDLADAYPGEPEETVLTEIVANALDSGASEIACVTDQSGATLTVVDNGVGMRRAELRRFHDLATSSKERGKGIGFAGVGIKLGLLVSDEVLTETRRASKHFATSWALTNRRRAPWRWIEPPGLVSDQGTAVRLRLANALSPLLDVGYIETTLRRHFEPLLNPFFAQMLAAHYPLGVRFVVNGTEMRVLEAREGGSNATIELRMPRKRTPSAFGFMMRTAEPAAEERRGIAISTYGKVIKRGWDWLGLSPVEGDRVTGLVEIPALAAALTLNKADFIRSGPRGAIYLSYRKALQEAVTERLSAWGDAPDHQERRHRRAARPVERDLETILVDLADDFPMLAALVDKRAGGPRRVKVYGANNGAGVSGSMPDLFAPRDQENGTNESETKAADNVPDNAPEGPEPRSAPQAGRAGAAMPSTASGGGKPQRRPIRLGLTIQLEPRAHEAQIARLVESTVWVNSEHPAYLRAVSSRSEGYHLALSVAMALAEVAVEPMQARDFVTEFLSRWGAALDRRGPGRKHPAAR